MPSPLELLLDPISLAVFALYLAMLGWEAVAPARAWPHITGWRLYGASAFVVFFFVSSYLPLLVGPFLAPLRLFNASRLGTVPGGLLAVFVYEGIGYAWHRAMHGSWWLFRGVHQMHHSAERFDVASSFWFSPLDMAGWTLVSTLALAVVGFNAAAITLFILLGTLMSIFQHANVRTPRWLGYFIQRPESHSWHHARARHQGNYAGLSLWDMLFGTFHNADDFAAHTGFGSGASTRVFDMLLLRDLTRGRVSVPPAPRAAAEERQSDVGTELA